MRRAIAAILAAGLSASAGCRQTWVQPEATEEKYVRDLYSCQYGGQPPTQDEIRTNPNRAKFEIRSDWKQCMHFLGWSSETRGSSSSPWARQ